MALPNEEVIGTTAAISQLLGQAITLVQKIQDAREKVHGTSKRIDDYEDQLSNLLSTLSLIQDERELQKPNIEKQVQVVIRIGEEFKGFLDSLAAAQAKSKSRQYMHALARGGKEGKTVSNLLNRLDRAKADLTTRIITAHVGMSGTMRDGFVVALADVQRVDRNVQRLLGQRLAIAAQLETSSSSQGEEGTIPLSDADLRALDIYDESQWIGNKAFDDAEMFNTDLVERKTQRPSKRLYKDTEAHGNSLAFQGNADAEGIAAIIRARRG